MSAMSDLKELIQRRSVVRNLLAVEMKVGHRDKVLGNLWQLLDPFLLMLVYYLIWSVILGSRGPDFMAYILSGIITFGFFQGAVVRSSVILRSQVRLVQEVYFPRSALPTAVTLARLYDFLWSLAALALVLIYLLFRQSDPAVAARITHPLAFGWNALWLPFAMAALFMFSLGFSYLSAIAGGLFRDTENILRFTFRLWFYMSPLFYYEEDMPRRIFFFYRMNPFTHFFRAIRNALIYDKPPTLDGTLFIVGLSLAAVVIGFWVFSRYEGSVVKQL